MKSPFQFLDAYGRQDRDKFFGRDKEINDLYEMMFKTPLVLVYGLSGTGKTSLVQCGLANRFDRADWYPLFIRRGEDINLSLEARLAKLAPDDNDLKAKIAAYQEGSLPISDLSKAFASEVVSCLDAFYDEYLRPPYLIFDQFEETFILGDRKEEEVFAHVIRAIVDSGLPVKVLLIMREEYLGHLNHFERVVPTLYDYRFRVEQMDDRKVANVIVHSCKHFNITLEGLESREKVTAFLKDEKRELEIPATVATIIESVRGDEEEGIAKKSVSRIQLPYLQVYLDGLYRQVLTDESWKAVETDFMARFPDIPAEAVKSWLHHIETLETADRAETPLTVERKSFCLDRLEKAGILSRDKENRLVRANYPQLEFTTAGIEGLGDIEEVLGGFLESQSEQIREQLLRDYQDNKISAEVLKLIGGYLDQTTIRTSQIELPGLISRDQFESSLELLEEAKILLRRDRERYEPVTRHRERLDKQSARLSERLEERFKESTTPALQSFLNAFVTLEGTKKPLTRKDIDSPRLSEDQLELCLDRLEKARVLRHSDDHYEVAHDALAKRIAEKRSQDQVAVLEITKIVRDRYNASQVVGRKKKARDAENFLTDQELRLVDQYRRRLREEKLLKSEEWDFIADSEARSRRRKVLLFLAGIAVIILLSAIFFGVGIYSQTRKNEQRLQEELCREYQQHAQTLLDSKQYFAAIEAYEKARGLEKCNLDPLKITEAVDSICNQCTSLVQQGQNFMDDRNFQLALEKYTEAREIIITKERLSPSAASYFQYCETIATLDTTVINAQIKIARTNLIDVKELRFDDLIARGDYFFQRRAPYYWDAFRYYLAAETEANLSNLTKKVAEAKERQQRITPNLLSQDIEYLENVRKAMLDAAGEVHARRVGSVIDSIQQYKATGNPMPELNED